ncbi:MAG: HAD family phosphatase [Pseudomonadota bacterium]
MTAIQLVIFDCDGVLMDSEIVAATAELEVYKTFGIEMEPSEFAERLAGMDSFGVKKRMEETLGHELPERVIEETRSKVNEKVIAEAKLVSGADAVLDLLDQARCVCSNAPPERLKKVLSRVGLYDRFRPYVFSAQDTEPPLFKPKPDIFLRAFGAFSVNPEEALVIEDSVHGIEGARSAGARVVGFTGASHTYAGHADQLIEAGAETVISRFSDLPAIVEAFGTWERLD